jgi:hypothetical protein
MSSPIASSNQGYLKRLLMRLHQRGSHTNRVSQLSEVITAQLASLPHKSKCIDIGCGDMSLAENLQQKIAGSSWLCYDIYPLPLDKHKDERWAKYRQFDGAKIDLLNQSQDVVLFCDVLHHATDEQKHQLLKEALRVARYVVIKDHFETSLFARWVLKLMDIYGNWGYGVRLPDRYFTRQSFTQQLSSVSAQTIDLKDGIDLYSHSFVLRNILSPRWQFVAVIKALD